MDTIIWTYIRVDIKTAKALRSLGGKGDTYDDIIKRLISGVNWNDLRRK